jgi:polyisoprenoid-binding protein YceI
VRRIAILAAAWLAFVWNARAQQKATYTVDAPKSKIEIHVGKEGFFSAFGHDHLIVAKEISGEAQVDAQDIAESSVVLAISAKSLAVLDPGESEKDKAEVQKTMLGEKVLDVEKYGQIRFTSARVSNPKKTGAGWELHLEGKLALHGVEKPISFPLRVRLDGDMLRAQAEVSLLQTDYGMTPVKVGGGAVKVKNRLKITLDIAARKKP